MLTPCDLATEYRQNPLGIDAVRPRLGWRLRGAGRGRRQTAYRVRVWEVSAAGQRLWWDSGVVPGREPVVPCGGPEARSRQAFAWTVQVRDEQGEWSRESTPATWEMGLLHSADWTAQWIALDPESPSEFPEAAPPVARVLSAPALLRRAWALPARPVRARLYATALGVYEAYVNGQRVGRQRLAPGWTDYRRRVRYQVYDVTNLLKAGANVLGLLLGDGWYAGYLGFGGHRQLYGRRPALLAQLEVELSDGTHLCLGTDGQWQGRSGPILYSDFLMGEAYDARREVPHWCEAPLALSGWRPAVAREAPPILVTADRDDGVVATERVEPISAVSPRPGAWLFDFGRNLVGQPDLTVSGSRGTMLQLRCAEVLDASGQLYTDNYRAAACTDFFTLAGAREESGEPSLERFHPTFAYRGFRYVEVTAAGELAAPPALSALVLESASEVAGQFRCGLPLANQLQANIVTSQRGNLVAVPTDCPQRDERLGWLGDAQAFADTALCNRDLAAFFSGWMETVRDSQSAAGAFPDVAPRIVDEADGAPAWGDAGVLVPAALYARYGDRQMLAENFPAMQRWVAYLTDANPDGLWRHRRANDFGDWLAVDPSTDSTLLATAYYAEDVRQLAAMASRLGREADAASYQALWQHIREAYQQAFLDPASGQLLHPTQTAAVLTLHMQLAPEAARPGIARQLADDIAARGGHLSTGFAGTAFLLPVLSDAGLGQVAHQLLAQTTYPSWGYMIRHGATSMWERWDGWTPDRGFQNPEMNSFNHYALGSVGAWLFGWVAGVRPDPADPGLQSVVVAPVPDPTMGWVSATCATPAGSVRVRWTQRASGRLVLGLRVPPSTTATVRLPLAPGQAAWESRRPLAQAPGVEVLAFGGAAVHCRVGSGRYRFVVDAGSPGQKRR